ncbi:MAG TPA: hypothetical protein VGL13_01440, partial [Polyangiaceae bacterium]
TITALVNPEGPGVRNDSGAYAGADVPSHYDPLISKLSVWGADRAVAMARMKRALGEYRIHGIRTNIAFHERVLAQRDFAAGHYDTGFIAAHRDELLAPDAADAGDRTALAAALAAVAARASAEPAKTNEPDAEHGLSPWVLAHRARSLGRS